MGDCGNLPNYLDSVHFRICYDASKVATIDVSVLAQNLENAWGWFESDGYVMPDLNGGWLTVYATDDIRLGCLIDDLADDRAVSLPGRIWIPVAKMLDQDLVVHELFHSVQWSYRNLWGPPSCSGYLNAYAGAYQVDGWFHESNAVWMEFYQIEQGRHAGPSRGYQGAATNGYWGSLGEYFEDTAQGLQGWIERFTGSQPRAYGEAIFSRFLELTQGGPNVIKTVWENAGDPSLRVTYAINSALGGSLSGVFADFAAANYTQVLYPFYYKWPEQIANRIKPGLDHIGMSFPANTIASGRAQVASLGAEYVRVANHAVPAGTQLNLDLEATVNALTPVSIM